MVPADTRCQIVWGLQVVPHTHQFKRWLMMEPVPVVTINKTACDVIGMGPQPIFRVNRCDAGQPPFHSWSSELWCGSCGCAAASRDSRHASHRGCNRRGRQKTAASGQRGDWLYCWLHWKTPCLGVIRIIRDCAAAGKGSTKARFQYVCLSRQSFLSDGSLGRRFYIITGRSDLSTDTVCRGKILTRSCFVELLTK